MTAAIFPGNDKTAILKAVNLGTLLGARVITINPELTANNPAITIVALGINIGIVVRIPGNNIAAIFKRRHCRCALVVGQASVNLELAFTARLMGLQRNLLCAIAGACLNDRSNLRHPIDGSNKTGLDIGHRSIPGSNPVAHRCLVNCHGIDIARLNGPRQGDHIGLTGRTAVLNDSDIIATAKINRLDIPNPKAIGLIAQRQGINSIPQIRHQAILRRRERQRFAARAANELDAGGTAIGIKTLRVDSIRRLTRFLLAIVFLIIGVPGNDKAAIIKRRYRRLALGTVNKGVDPKLFTQRLSAIGKNLPTDISSRTAIVAAVILPGNDIAPTCEAGDRRRALGT